MVQDHDIKDEIASEAMLGAGNQHRVRDCSALAVFLADLEPGKRIKRVYRLEQERGNRNANYTASLPVSSSFLLGEGHTATYAKNLAGDVFSRWKPMPKVESAQAWSYKNTSLFVQSYLLAATSHELATSPMEGFDPRRAMEVLRIPPRYAIPMMVATGYDYDDTSQANTPRLDLEEFVFNDSFGVPFSRNEQDSVTTK